MNNMELSLLNSYIKTTSGLLRDITSFAPKPRRQQLKDSVDHICSEWSEILKGNKSGREDFDRALDSFKVLFSEVYEESRQARLLDDQLTEQQRAFCHHYVRCENATEAAREAKYRASSLKVLGYGLLQKRHVRFAIQRLREEQ